MDLLYSLPLPVGFLPVTALFFACSTWSTFFSLRTSPHFSSLFCGIAASLMIDNVWLVVSDYSRLWQTISLLVLCVMVYGLARLTGDLEFSVLSTLVGSCIWILSGGPSYVMLSGIPVCLVWIIYRKYINIFGLFWGFLWFLIMGTTNNSWMAFACTVAMYWSWNTVELCKFNHFYPERTEMLQMCYRLYPEGEGQGKRRGQRGGGAGHRGQRGGGAGLRGQPEQPEQLRQPEQGSRDHSDNADMRRLPSVLIALAVTWLSYTYASGAAPS